MRLRSDKETSYKPNKPGTTSQVIREIPKEHWGKLKSMAYEMNIPTSELVRRLIDQCVSGKITLERGK